MEFVFEIDTREMEAARRKTPQLFRDFIGRLGAEVKMEAVDLVGGLKGNIKAEATGNLKGKLFFTVEDGANPTAVIGAGARYAEYVHEGTGIYGPRKKPLGKGRPGNKGGMRARPFLMRAVENVMSEEGRVRRLWELAVGGKD